MNDEKWKIIATTLIVSVAILGFFSIFWAMELTNIVTTYRFEMDDNTSNYLNEHDYCFFTEQTSYDSSEPSIVFVGDCQYLNTTILKVS